MTELQKQIVRDALVEFIVSRATYRGLSSHSEGTYPDLEYWCEPYVQRRYSGMGAQFQTYKVKEVAQRVRAAAEMLESFEFINH